MGCPSCQSGHMAEFTSEMMIHFSGIRNIDDPGVLAVPKVMVCLDCGFSQFTAPYIALRALRKGSAAAAA